MTRALLTCVDYAALPDDGRRCALHEGEHRRRTLALHAEHGVALSWIADPASRPPLPDLVLDPAAVWA